MPQISKGGKFVFGTSIVREDGTVRIPPQAADEYRIADEGKVYLFTGSKSMRLLRDASRVAGAVQARPHPGRGSRAARLRIRVWAVLEV
ncbi:hypothetical protein [Arabiibacter massiliensis]|uniref:hypothetical protein n=1 Tax=Arabiibacter massiliensis TaxID=1870985 RepID=UPI001E3B4CF0|nr:hypothetical protein [Arabiibacter massiliensis]